MKDPISEVRKIMAAKPFVPRSGRRPLSDEEQMRRVKLFARWWAGERIDVLAKEAGLTPASLGMYFRQLRREAEVNK